MSYIFQSSYKISYSGGQTTFNKVARISKIWKIVDIFNYKKHTPIIYFFNFFLNFICAYFHNNTK